MFHMESRANIGKGDQTDYFSQCWTSSPFGHTGGALAYRKLRTVSRTFGVEGDEAVAQRPLLHRLFQDHLLREDDHVDVVEPAEALQDLGHGLGFGLLGHGADAHHNLSLWRLVREETRRGRRRMEVSAK